MTSDTTNHARKKPKPKRWVTCDECNGKGKKPIYWDSEDELT